MGTREETEFLVLLLIENNCYNSMEFEDYIKTNYNINKINKRYRELLDDFLKDYMH